MTGILLPKHNKVDTVDPFIVVGAGHAGVFHVIAEQLCVGAVVGQIVVAYNSVYFGEPRVFFHNTVEVFPVFSKPPIQNITCNKDGTTIRFHLLNL